MTRDSLILILGMLGGLVLYLAGNKPPWEWDYYSWLAFIGYAITGVSGWLTSSPLAGTKTDPAKTQTIFGGLVKLTKESKP